MHGIWPMAALTLVLSTLLWGGFLALLSRERRYLWLLLPGLPLSALVNRLVKAPLGASVGRWSAIEPGLGRETPLWFILFLFMLAPVCEEVIKVAPLLLSPIRRLVTSPRTGLWAGMGLGLSFGLGEALYLAYGIAQSSEYADLPWYLFTGYAGERLAVTLVHGLMTALFTYGLARGWLEGLAGYAAAVGFHALINSGALFYQLGLVKAGIAQIPYLATIFLLVFVFERVRRGMHVRDEMEGADEIVYFRRGEGSPREPDSQT
ncbi:MAG: hypothetical protein ACLFU8_02205 [Anaerolineales bacterium]